MRENENIILKNLSRLKNRFERARFASLERDTLFLHFRSFKGGKKVAYFRAANMFTLLCNNRLCTFSFIAQRDPYVLVQYRVAAKYWSSKHNIDIVGCKNELSRLSMELEYFTNRVNYNLRLLFNFALAAHR